MGKFFGWVAGILSFVIGGYILWYLTRPTVIEGMVIDRSQNVAVEKALVTVEVPSARNGPFDTPTDANGSYVMELSSTLSWQRPVRVHVTAKGFQVSPPATLTLSPGGNRKDFFLMPIVPPPAPPPPPGVHPTAVAELPAYVPSKLVAKFQLQMKR